MKRIPKHLCFFLLVFLSAFENGQAQNAAKADSFLKKINSLPPDTNRIKALLNYSSWLIDYNKDSAIGVAKGALLLSRQNTYPFGEGQSYNLQGIAHAERGEHSAALEAYQNALAPFTAANGIFELGKVYNNIGNAYNHLGRLEEATEHYFKSIQYFERLKHPLVSGLYNNLAVALLKLKQYDKVIHYTQLGLPKARQGQDSITLVNLLTTISSAYIESGKVAESYPFLKETYTVSARIGYTAGHAVAHLNIADYHSYYKRYDSALFYLRRARSLALEAGDPTYVEEAYYAMAKVHFTLKQYKETYQNLLQSLQVGRTINDREHLAKTYHLLSDYHVSQGQYASGLDAFRQSKVYEDSLRSEATVRNIQALEARYRTAEKDKQLARQQLAMAETSAQLARKDTLIWAVVAGIVVVCFILFLLVRHHRQSQRLQKLQIQTLRQENEMKALKSQIEPHFLFNTLNSISASVPASLENTREMIAQLADTFRYGLATNGKKEVRLEDELNFIKTWLSLEQARLGKRLKVVYEIDENTLHYAIPPMLLQPLIENALEHGIGPKVEGGKVIIECKRRGEYVMLAVTDTGMGYDGNLADLYQKGIGVSNTAKRLQLLLNEQLHVERGEQGLRFFFKLPVAASVVFASNGMND